MPRSLPTQLVAAMTLLATAACGDVATETAEAGPMHNSASVSQESPVNIKRLPADVQQWLGELREAIRPLENFNAAYSAGYTGTPLPCSVQKTVGGQGVHYINGGLISATPNPLAPSVLMFESQKDGSKKLVGVEFIIPYSLIPAGSTPPDIHGIAFHETALGLWALHVWMPAHNARGIFADWNPTVSCKYDAP
jgi:hypothetical protein